MKPRCELTACEVGELLDWLALKVEGQMLRTQPEVGARVLELANDPDAGLNDFAMVVRTDQALSGRLLKMVNSAYYAQRQPVTAIERACVLLGLDRLKAIVLGFVLSRSAADPTCKLSRRIWGESIFRASLAAQLTPAGACGRAGEGFIVGLMLDAGVPLMAQLLGGSYLRLYEECNTPAGLFERECAELPYTHVDVIKALMRYWGLPEVLARPIEWHHTQPGESDRPEPIYKLQRVAFYVGSLTLRDGGAVPAGSVPNRATAERVLGVTPERLRELVGKAMLEYSAILDLFGDVADSIENMDQLAERAHIELVETVDGFVRRCVQSEQASVPESLMVGDNRVEIEHTHDGACVAFLYDSDGMRLVSYRFMPSAEDAPSLLAALGLDEIDDASASHLEQLLCRLAA